MSIYHIMDLFLNNCHKTEVLQTSTIMFVPDWVYQGNVDNSPATM